MERRNWGFLGNLAEQNLDGNFLPASGTELDYGIPGHFAWQVERGIFQREVVRRYDRYAKETLKRPALLLKTLASIDASEGRGHDASETPDYEEWSILTQFCKVCYLSGWKYWLD